MQNIAEDFTVNKKEKIMVVGIKNDKKEKYQSFEASCTADGFGLMFFSDLRITSYGETRKKF